jgi:hypothetical protein
MEEATRATIRDRTVVIEKDTEIKLGPAAIEAARREQIRELHEALTEVRAAEEDLTELHSEEARGQLERLGHALKRATTATDALWWFAPSYGEER